MRLSTIFWDLDGTLVNSSKSVIASLTQAFAQLGETMPDGDLVRIFIGPPLRQSLGGVFDGDDARVIRAIEKFRCHYAEQGLYETEIVQGVHDVLASLSARGVQHYLATAKPRVYAEKIVAHLKMGEHFEQVYGPSLDGHHDRKADLIAMILDEQGIDPTTVVMVGDTVHDVNAAAAHGIETVGVCWGTGSGPELLEAGAIGACETMEVLHRLLEGLLDLGPEADKVAEVHMVAPRKALG